jgi:hypothetical protein
MTEILASVFLCIVIVAALIMYLYAGYNICSGYRSVGQKMVKFFDVIDRSKEFVKKVKTRKIEPSRAAFIKCVLCAPARLFYEGLRHQK